ncbi:hypothetical protein GT045_07485 [Streptomyces sp. SID486]|uniref:hypothetical protein n=1 Tax=unclassified Streptomyces TaxID=2593676 RepID=UPI0013BDF6EE|nr:MULTISPECIES: hypothetical protein [unclassified Streptomyces]MYW15093.1 hypothetical protein [Streptomyces sp. SID2955]MYW42340.1 hypothetical protein [Streptomyces sp. SID161]MYX94659.1 hypothetical protein [Streptomyces sp. SID486]
MTVTREHTPPATDARTAASAAAFLEGQEITTTGCGRCGTEISGVNGRYACGNCGWVNHWSEGHTQLPAYDPVGNLPSDEHP